MVWVSPPPMIIPYHWSCIHFWVKPSIVGPHYLPTFGWCSQKQPLRRLWRRIGNYAQNPSHRRLWWRKEFRSTTSVADLRGGHPWGTPPLRPKIFSISCSIWENLTKLYVDAPWRVGASSYGESWIRPWRWNCLIICCHRWGKLIAEISFVVLM